MAVYPIRGLTPWDLALRAYVDDAFVAQEASLSASLNEIAFSVKQFGAVGDGTSRPLNTIYGSFAAAQAAFPMPYLEAATWATRELDWAAGQYANHLVSPFLGGGEGGRVFWPKGHYVTNKGIYVGDDSINEGEGPGTWVDNIAPRNTPSENQYGACPFYFGVNHPAIMGAGNSYRYRIATLAPITAGDRTLTVPTPAQVDAPLAAGDIVLIRCNNTPDTFGSGGVVYAFAQWNRVESWDAGTGTLVLEEPMDESIAATPTDSVVGGPRLLVNPGVSVVDPISKMPWRVVQRAHLRDMRLSGLAPIGLRVAAWGCSVRDIVGEFQHLWSSNAFVNSLAENITGTFSNRFAEIKHVCQGSTFRRIQGTYRYVAGVTTDPPISIGEAAYRVRLEDCVATFGKDYVVTNRALETSTCRDVYADVELRFHPSSGVQSVWIIKSTPHPSLPPSDIHLKLKVRGPSGMTRYGTIGSDAIADAIDNEGNPTRVTLDLDQKAEGTKPTYCYQVERGHFIREIRNVSDVVVVQDSSSIGDLVDGGVYKMTSAGPHTIPPNSSIRVGPFTAKGVTTGDHIEATAQGGTFTSGNATYLTAVARVSGVETWYLMLRNEYPTGGTTITITGNVTVRYRLRRVV